MFKTACEQLRVLWNPADLLVPLFSVKTIKRLAVDEDFTPLKRLETEQQIEKGGLASTTGAYYGQPLTSRNSKAEVVQCWCVAAAVVMRYLA